MPEHKNLFVTMSTDLGSNSICIALQKTLEPELEFFQYDLINIKRYNNIFKKCYMLFKNIITLRKKVSLTTANGSKVIFMNLKPALLTYDLWNSSNSLTCSDFSHSLFNWFEKKPIKRDIRFYFQKILFLRFHKILAWTENYKMCIHEVYNVPFHKIVKVPLPFELDFFKFEPLYNNLLPNVLFIGGEFFRKGGDILLNAWNDILKGRCNLIIVTKDKISIPQGVEFHNDVVKGTDKHFELFYKSDIFILPTRRDAYPYVLAEASVAGLTIITTKYALGAKELIEHGINGFIADSPSETIQFLDQLLNDKDKLIEFRKKTLNFINTKYCLEIIKNNYLLAIN